MVVQRIGNNTSKSNTICGSPSCSARDRKETKFKNVCSSGLQNTCIRTAECKSGQYRYSYNGKEVILYFVLNIENLYNNCCKIIFV